MAKLTEIFLQIYVAKGTKIQARLQVIRRDTEAAYPEYKLAVGTFI
jgi:hypothetical protein